jgi:DNA (cytosine-5)-methyltransferase 1
MITIEPHKKYLMLGEAAKMLGVSKNTLRDWDNAGKFEADRHPFSNYRIYSLEKIKTFPFHLWHGEIK